MRYFNLRVLCLEASKTPADVNDVFSHQQQCLTPNQHCTREQEPLVGIVSLNAAGHGRKMPILYS
jgi:hypothetical protein